jgi:hypothetical protein
MFQTEAYFTHDNYEDFTLVPTIHSNFEFATIGHTGIVFMWPVDSFERAVQTVVK